MKGKEAVGPMSEELTRALRQWDALIDREFVDSLQPSSPQTVYTTSVVVMLLLAQRLQGNASLERVVAEYLQLWRNEAAGERKLSTNTAAYSRARARLERRTAEQLCDLTSAKTGGGDAAVTRSTAGIHLGWHDRDVAARAGVAARISPGA